MKVLITTSGTGSRLGELTKFTNKSLVAVGDKPTLTRIINLYPDQTEFIITVGHFGDIVREYIEIAHPECNVEFVEVAKFEGLGSSLGHSMLCASDLLQEPFVFHASDALLTSSPIPEPKSNWVGGAKRSDANTYSSFDSNKGLVTKFHEKGEIEYDLIHIGLVGIQEYEKFWSCLRHLYEQNPNDTSINTTNKTIFTDF
jgi:NDP-sugar pyrophosphorylase family protein